MRLIIATKNKGKFREIKRLLRYLKIELISLNELDDKINIKETGRTFVDNAFKKAKVVSLVFPDDLVVGEDSGLEVAHIGGAPGVYSKRYSGKNATDIKNNRKVLKELEGVPRKERKARYCCVLALCREGKLIKKYKGILPGYIYKESKGRGGFGYDPVFYLPGYKRTVAQISLKEKNKISHRAKVFLKLKNFLANYLKNK